MKPLLPILLLVFSVGIGAYDGDDLKKLKATKKCVECDLSGANLGNAHLSSSNLEGANLTNASLTGANLYEANLTGADLFGAKLCKTRMPDFAMNDSDCDSQIASQKPPKKVASPKPTVASTKRHTLTIRSNVTGDSVYVDGTYKGSTRLDLILDVGSYAVRVEKRGYNPFNQSIYLGAILFFGPHYQNKKHRSQYLNQSPGI